MKFQPIGQGDFQAAADRLQQLSGEWRDGGERWVKTQAHRMHDRAVLNLSTQGRGRLPPPLSEATQKIYQHDGPPDGSGVRNHIEIEYQRIGSKFVAIVGIPEGQPSLVARVQENGASIPVTEPMRGWLAMRGIFLRASTTHIQIPGRHFWEEAFRDTAQNPPRIWG